jgi:hypothetical protein
LRDQMLRRFEDEPNRRIAIERTLEAMPMHSTMPAIASLRVDDGGNLWVQEYTRPGEENRDWLVFSAAGRCWARSKLRQTSGCCTSRGLRAGALAR